MKRRKTSLILSIICFAVGIACAWGIVEMAYAPYEHIIKDSIKLELYGPKRPYSPDFEFDWKYRDRFNYHLWKETVNC